MEGPRELSQFVQYMVGQLISHPEKAVLKVEEKSPEHIIFHVFLEKLDVGKVIGKQGQTIDAIRCLMAGAATKYKFKVGLNVNAHGEEPGSRPKKSASA